MIRARTFAGAAAALLALASRICVAQDLDLKVYGSTGYSVFSNSSAATAPNGPNLYVPVSNSFAASLLELLPTATYERLTFLAEVVFESDAPENEFSIDVERLQAMYLFSDLLRIKVGRVHTAFGYYNDAYHHARLFELTTGRPYITNFEDSGGLIPAHLVGVGIDGRLDTGRAGAWTYNLDVGNARLADITAVPISLTTRGAKAVNLRLRFLPNALDGLIVGVNALYDRVPGTTASASAPVLSGAGFPVPLYDLNEFDFGAHAAYVEGRVHVIFEAAYMLHSEPATGAVFHNFDAFLEAGYAFNDFTPYARYEQIRFDPAGDPLYQSSLLANTGNLYDGRLGVKWMPNEHVALKLEGRELKSNLGSAQFSASVQCAFGF